MIPGDKALYPGTDVLVNKLDIRDAAQLRNFEYKSAAARELQLVDSPIKGNYDFDHLKAIHAHLFQDVYTWAGQLRELDMAKGNKETRLINQFIPLIVMDLKVEELSKFVADKNQLKGMSKAEFVTAFSELHTKLDALHPFREGNGRSTRVFLDQLATDAGYQVDWSKLERDRWKLASHLALPQIDPKNPDQKIVPSQFEKRQIFHEITRPTIAHAFLHEKREDAVKLYPQLNGSYQRLDAISAVSSKLAAPGASEKVVEAEKQRIAAKLQQGETPTMNPYLQGRVDGLNPVKSLSASKTMSTQAAVAGDAAKPKRTGPRL